MVDHFDARSELVGQRNNDGVVDERWRLLQEHPAGSAKAIARDWPNRGHRRGPLSNSRAQQAGDVVKLLSKHGGTAWALHADMESCG